MKKARDVTHSLKITRPAVNLGTLNTSTAHGRLYDGLIERVANEAISIRVEQGEVFVSGIIQVFRESP